MIHKQNAIALNIVYGAYSTRWAHSNLITLWKSVYKCYKIALHI